VPFARDRERLGYETMSRVLYRAADGSWRTAEPGAGVSRLYTLRHGERWTLLEDDRVMVVHADRPPKVVYPDGRVEEIAPTPLSQS
jgi:hypothetical protein